ncbi:MAG: DUF1553 domain-containing protein [Chthoniobacteraceae bacterium]
MPPRRFILAASLVALSRAATAADAPITPEAHDFFEAKIRPVLVAECYECHNAKKTKGGLRLDYRDGWKKGGDTGDAIVPGDARKSLLITSIRHEDPDLKMPAKSPKLEDKVIADFEKWVNMGAPDPRDAPPADDAAKPSWKDLLATRRTWWSLQPVTKPEPPVVQNAAWSANPIDRFLAAKLDEHKLAPAAPADARTFIRRLTFTLTGLPPTPEEVEAFAAESIRNPQSATRDSADRLLASPRFGEHSGRHWLDLMRYAETHGSEGDPEIREAWRYRDYVIRALNADVPLDQFIREHLAGDLLPKPRMNADGFSESILGTANLRLVEHGFQPVDTLDDQVKAVDNQIDVVSKAFQGLTVSCARCHDHKFDAVSERDYYALYSIFASVRPAQVTIDAPELQQKNRAALERLHGEIKDALAAAWLPAATRLGDLLGSEASQAEGSRRTAAEIAEIEKQIAGIEWTARLKLNAASQATPARTSAAPIAVWTFERDASDALGGADGHLEGGAEVRDGKLILGGNGAYLRTDTLPKTLLTKTLEAWVSPSTLDQKGGGVISIESTGPHGFDAIVFAEKDPRQWVAGSNFFKRSERLNAPEETAKPGEFVHVAVTYAANGTITFYRNGQPYGASYAKPPLLEFAAKEARVLLGLRHKGAGSGFFAGEIEEARLYDRALTAEEVTASFRAGTPPFVSAEQITAALTAAQREERSVLEKKLSALKSRASPQAVGGEQWAAALKDAVGNVANPLHPWAKLGAVPAEQFGPEWAKVAAAINAKRDEAEKFNTENYRPLWNLAGADYAQWFPYGAGLPKEANLTGDFSVEAQGDRVIDGLLPAGVMSHRLSDKQSALLTSPRFKIDSDSISVRASGGGGAMVRVIVDNYPLPSNPIFPKATFENEQPGWVRLDTAYRKGSWAYLEFGTRDDLTRPLAPGKAKGKAVAPSEGRSHFSVSEIVAHNSSEPPRELPLATLALLREPAPRNASELALRYADAAASAVRAWRDGTLDRAQTALLDFLIRNGALPATLADLGNAQALFAEYRRLESEVPVPRRAPGVLETAGFDSPFLSRGEHTKPGDPVPRGYLEVFGGHAYQTKLSGRLELAEEITSAKNPLTARVMANRVWHWMFGRGIAPTVDNFGRLGEKPTHPELLDYLASRLMENGWSIKSLIRDIALTQAFQMSSDPTLEAQELDPANEWLSHFRVRRLEAEAIRDSLLAVSGELSGEMYGSPAAAGAPRRSIYLQVKRTNLNPFLQTFDAPKPFTTLGRRDATNVPGQSLTMLNSPFVIEQAQKWARRLARAGSASPDDRIRAMFASAFARTPADDELTNARAYLNLLAADRKVSPEQSLTSEPLWQDFAQSLFNLKEFIYLR